MKTALIAGGGTGGHLYPALAIANAVKKLDPEMHIHFVGSQKGLEVKIVPREGYPLHLIAIGGLARSGLIQKLKTLLLVPVALVQSLVLILRLKPQFVLGVGGYASGPVLLMAALLRKRTFIFEPNAYPGLANRLLAPFVSTSFVVFENAIQVLKSSKSVKAGLPVRETIRPVKRVPSNQFRVLVFGGSQGARGINRVIGELIRRGGSWIENVEFVHQTGRHDINEMKSLYQSSDPVQVFEYLDDIQNYYAWADLVICRSGASTIAELAACRKASVLVPLATATDNHQQKNAEALANEGAGVMILQKDFTVDTIRSQIEKFKNNPKEIETLETRIQKFDSPGAAHKMAVELLDGGKV